MQSLGNRSGEASNGRLLSRELPVAKSGTFGVQVGIRRIPRQTDLESDNCNLFFIIKKQTRYLPGDRCKAEVSSLNALEHLESQALEQGRNIPLAWRGCLLIKHLP